MTQLILSRIGQNTFADFLHGRVQEWQRSWADYRLFRRTLAELQSLSTRELNDLGISRSEIAHIAVESVYGSND